MSKIGACSDCGGKVSAAAEKCPHCGRPVDEETKDRKRYRSKGSRTITDALILLGCAAVAVALARFLIPLFI